MTACTAVSAWIVAWSDWSIGERIAILAFLLVALAFHWFKSPSGDGGRNTGQVTAAFLGGLFAAFCLPTEAARNWPVLLEAFNLLNIVNLIAPWPFVSYAASLVILALLWGTGATIAKSGLSAIRHLNAVGVHHAKPGNRGTVNVPLPRWTALRLVLHYACLALVLLFLLNRTRVLSPIRSFELQNPARAIWAMTADGTTVGEILPSGQLVLVDLRTGSRETNLVSCCENSSPRDGYHWAELPHTMRFLPGDKSLLLDCSPYNVPIFIDTETWRQIPSDWNIREGLIDEEIRWISNDSSIVVTSKEATDERGRILYLTNDISLNFWSMPERERTRAITVSPDDDLWVSHRSVVVSTTGNLLVWQVRHGTQPGSQTECWDLATGEKLPLPQYVIFKGAISANDRYLACHGSIFDRMTADLVHLDGDPVCYCGDRALIAKSHDHHIGTLPVWGSLLSAALEQRLLIYDISGKHIRAVTNRLPSSVVAIRNIFRWSPNSDYFCVRLDSDGKEVLVYEIP